MRFFLFCFLFCCSLVASETISPSDKIEQKDQPTEQVAAEPVTESEKNHRRILLNTMRKGVVIIKVKAHINATEPNSQSWPGTGFIVDKSRGLVATNRHVAGDAMLTLF